MKRLVNPNSDLRALDVFVGGRRVGTLQRLGGDSHIFSFTDDYIHDEARPALSLSFKSASGGLVTSLRAYSRRLPPFFANLLPEGHLRAYLAGKAGVKPEREFFLLAALGSDLPGAVCVAPAESGVEPSLLAPPAPKTNDEPSGSERILRFSLAGVQLKFSAVLESRGGLTVPAEGTGGSWIVKLPSMQYNAVPENEFVMLELARAVGISVPKSRLVRVREIGGLPRDARLKGVALAVKRFDRGPKGARIHMEDFAQVFGLYPDGKYGERSYANLAAVLNAETGDAGVYEFVRRVVFSIVIGNADMHLKNWSLLYPDGRKPVLSPAYDFVSTTPYIPDDTLALSFGGSKSLREITQDQVRRFAETARLPKKLVWDLVNETVQQTKRAWRKLEQKAVLPAKLRGAIDEQIAAVAVK